MKHLAHIIWFLFGAFSTNLAFLWCRAAAGYLEGEFPGTLIRSALIHATYLTLVIALLHLFMRTRKIWRRFRGHLITLGAGVAVGALNFYSIGPIESAIVFWIGILLSVILYFLITNRIPEENEYIIQNQK